MDRYNRTESAEDKDLTVMDRLMDLIKEERWTDLTELRAPRTET